MQWLLKVTKSNEIKPGININKLTICTTKQVPPIRSARYGSPNHKKNDSQNCFAKDKQCKKKNIKHKEKVKRIYSARNRQAGHVFTPDFFISVVK